MAWVRVCGVGDVPPGEAIRVDADSPVAVFNVGSEFLATADTCTHANFSLSDGYIDDGVVECAAHSAKFDLRTGKALSLPATEGLATYPVKVEGDDVFVDI